MSPARSALAVLALLLIVTGLDDARAAAVNLPIDRQASAVRFRIAVFYLFRVEGRFADFSVQLEVDREQDWAQVHAVIVVASVAMANPEDVRTVLGEDYFDAGRHPEIRFQSNAFPLASLKHGGTVPGRLRIRDIEQPVRLELQPEGQCDPEALDAGDCTLRAHTRVSRSAFGMRARRGILSDAVDLDLTLVLARGRGD